MGLSIEAVRNVVVPVLLPYARRIALFGSAARGESRPDSDVDLLIDLRPPEHRPPLGLKWFGLEATLAERLGRRVELVTEEALSRYIRPYVERDMVVLYED